MKTKILFVLLCVHFSSLLFSQYVKDSCRISAKDIFGTWQRDDSIVGSGLNQNFKFLKNNHFILSLSNATDDVRSILQLKGKYQLIKNQIYFTIMSRIVIDGSIETTDEGVSLNIFEISGNKTREIPERIPKELGLCNITVFSKTHIKINNEVYYKVKVK